MTGKILLVDAMVTNRIVLKVKLSAAFYTVLQAGSGKEAVEMAGRNAPDLLVIGSDLPDMSTGALLQSLRQGHDLPPPVVVLLPDDCQEKRLEALRTGAADVVSRPFDETVLLARLRSLLRQRHADIDLRRHSATADALSFAEEPAVFKGPEQVTILADDMLRANDLRDRLVQDCRQKLTALSYNRFKSVQGPAAWPDVIVMRISPNNPNAGLSMMAELNAAPMIRNTRLIAVLDKEVENLSAPLLDMGVSDVVNASDDDRELLMRISNQISLKRRADMMRSRLENGLQAALTDPLTGLYNRRYALHFLRQMIAGATREARTCAIMVADLDHFKTVNDT